MERSSFVKKYLEIAFHEDEKSNTLRVRSASSPFSRKYQRTKGDHAEADKYVSVIVCNSDTV